MVRRRATTNISYTDGRGAAWSGEPALLARPVLHEQTRAARRPSQEARLDDQRGVLEEVAEPDDLIHAEPIPPLERIGELGSG